jgi:DNA-binding XRE family transcriptional regulator
MVERTPNRVREFREQRGLSQNALAAAATLSRQSLHAIESSRALPAVDTALKLARALDCSVEALFAEAGNESRISTELVGARSSSRVALSHIGGRWLSYPLEREGLLMSADAIVKRASRGRAEVVDRRERARCGARAAPRAQGAFGCAGRVVRGGRSLFAGARPG